MFTSRRARITFLLTAIAGCSTPVTNPNGWYITSPVANATVQVSSVLSVTGVGPASGYNTLQIGLQGNLPTSSQTIGTGQNGAWSSSIGVPNITGQGYLAVGEFHLGAQGLTGDDAHAIDILIN